MSEAAVETDSVVGGAVEEGVAADTTAQDSMKTKLDELYPSMADKTTSDDQAESPSSETDEADENAETESDEAKSADDDKPNDDETGKPKAEEADASEYKFETPDGYELSEEKISKFSEVASKYKMDGQDAQGLLNVHFEMLVENEKLADKAFQETRRSWVEDGKADPKLGGENYKQSKQDVARAMNLVGDDSLREFFNHGAGDHPSVFRAFAAIGRHIREGSFKITTIGGNVDGGPGYADLYPQSPDLKD